MQVTLAYAWTDPDGQQHAGGETVDVPDETGRLLLHDGKARLATGTAPDLGTSLDLDQPGRPPIPDAVGYPGPTLPKE